jgi:hypothetical protein
MPLEFTKPSQSRQTRSSSTSASPDNTNTSPSSRFQRSSTPLPVWPTRCKSTLTTTTLRRTDANTLPNSKRSLANPSSPQNPSSSPNQNKRRLPLQHPLLLNHLPKVPLLISLISLAQLKINNNPWLRILLSSTRSKQVRPSLRSMFNPWPSLLSKLLSPQTPLVLPRTRNSWRHLLLSFNHNLLVLDLVVMVPSRSNRSNRNRQASPRILSIQLSSNHSRVRRLNNSNSHPSCNKSHSLCSSNKILLACNNNSNLHKCNRHHNRSSHKQLILFANR